MNSACPRQAKPGLELLEDRLSPANAAFVNYLYSNILARTPQSDEIAYWVNQSTNQTNEHLAERFWASLEHRTLQVQTYYQTILQRSVDSGSQVFWVGQMMGGLDESAVQSRLYGSAEFTDIFFSTAAYVDSLYATILHRQADNGGKNFWTAALATRWTPEQTARGFLDSAERTFLLVRDAYHHYLGREPAASELGWWSTFLKGRQNEQQLNTSILSSPEAASQYGGGNIATATVLVSLINEQRTKNSLQVLALDSRLNAVAKAHGNWMAYNNLLTSQAGTLGYFGRLFRGGYKPLSGGENIFQGLEQPQDVLKAWMASAPHRNVLLNSGFTQIGVSVSRAVNGVNYWVADLATPMP